MSLERAEDFGRYRLVRELGRGGEATVHLAEDGVLGRRVALKVFPRVLGARASGEPSGFRREVEALTRLKHPGICSIHDAGVHEGCAFIAMTYVEGRSLAEAPPTGEDEAVRIAAEVAGIVGAAHRSGIVHGDLKPSNILVTAEGRCVVLDFGVAHLADASTSPESRRAGTLMYLAPERLARAPDARSDVYGLGAVVFESVTGRPPLPAPTQAALVERLRNEDVPLLRAIVPRASKDLEGVLAKALARDPGRRYPDMTAFASDLAKLAAGAPVSARRYGPVARTLRWAARHVAAAALIVAVVVLLSAWTVVSALKTRDLEGHLASTRAAAERAASEQRAAEEHVLRYERIADRRRVRDLSARAARLVPPGPELIPALEAWGSEAGVLVSRLGGHRRALEELRARGRVVTDGSGRSRELDDLEARLASLEKDSPAATALRGLIDRLAAANPATSQRTYSSDDDAWHDAALSALVEELEQFADQDRGTVAAVAERAEQSRAVAERAVASRDAWERARRSIANVEECPRYAGLVIEPQLGLVPLGRDAASGLWEFLHVISGSAPEKDAAGRLRIGPETGIVLVLLPGGSGRMGAVRPEPGAEAGPNVDPLANPDESPLDDVPLDAFLISKFEMTDAQWLRARGDDPPAASRPRIDSSGERTTPVVSIDWNQAVTTLLRIGLELPTEAQWEYAARAGTTTPWWTGTDVARLRGAAVFATHAIASVGGRAPNPFGLHDVAGNADEWCRDVFARYEEARMPGTGERSGLDDLEHRVSRGGGFRSAAAELRSARRMIQPPKNRLSFLGVRPARRLDRRE